MRKQNMVLKDATSFSWTEKYFHVLKATSAVISN